MKFAHLADCHVGGWRDPKLTELSIQAFEEAISKIIDEQVDFVVLAGDLFNTSLPGIESIKRVANSLRQLKESNTPLYFIAGSHDYSPSGKTMLDVLEQAGLGTNVAKAKQVEGKLSLQFTVDEKTGAKITGILGKMGGLDKEFYRNLLREPLEREEGYKIFLFHALLTELKPKDLEKVDSHELSLLPKNFNYYAGGHPHFRFSEDMKGYGRVAYTGPLFPNSFSEIEELKHGGFYVVENSQTKFVPIHLKEVLPIYLNVDKKSSEDASLLLKEACKKEEVHDKIVCLRVEGTLSSGKPSEMPFQEVLKDLQEKNCFALLRNTTKLTAKSYDETKVEVHSPKEVEEKLIKEGLLKDSYENAEELAQNLLNLLDTEKKEGERVIDFEQRLLEDLKKIIP